MGFSKGKLLSPSNGTGPPQTAVACGPRKKLSVPNGIPPTSMNRSKLSVVPNPMT